MTQVWDTMPWKRPTKIDPPVVYSQIRESGELARVRFPFGEEGWLATTFDDVVALFSHPDLVAEGRPRYEVKGARRGTRTPFSGTFVNFDGDAHLRYRRLLAGRFSVRWVREHLQAFIDRAIDEHLAAILAGPKEFDLVEALALPVPSLVICEILGVPLEDRDDFNQVSIDMMNLSRPQELREKDQKWVFDYMRSLIASKRETGATEGLIAELIAAAPKLDFEVTDEDLVRIGALLLVAGHDTTANMISLSVLTLLTDPEARAAVEAGDARIETVVEELLRFLSIVHFGLARTARADIEHGGTIIRAGELVVMSVVGANRDPRMYEEPDTLDFGRQALRHVAFGYGAHQCLGQNVARAELRSVLPKVLAALPGLALAQPVDDVPMHVHSTNYGVEVLRLVRS